MARAFRSFASTAPASATCASLAAAAAALYASVFSRDLPRKLGPTLLQDDGCLAGKFPCLFVASAGERREEQAHEKPDRAPAANGFGGHGHGSLLLMAIAGTAIALVM